MLRVGRNRDLGIALAKSGVVARWVGAALAVSQPIQLVSAIILPSKLLDVTLGWGLTAVGFALVSVAVLRMSDDEFDAALGEALQRLSPSRAAAEVAERLKVPRKRAYARALELAR